MSVGGMKVSRCRTPQKVQGDRAGRRPRILENRPFDRAIENSGN